MNENELKDLWKNAEVKETPIIDFEQMQKNLNDWQEKLRKRIRLEFILGIIMTLAVIPLFSIDYDLLLYVPLIVITSIWYYGKLWKIYKEKPQSINSETTKKFLESITSDLTSFIQRMRIMFFIVTPCVAFSTIFFRMTFEKFRENWLTVLLLLIFTQIFVIAFCEIYFRMMYFPTIKKSKELLKQLDAE